MNCLFCKSINIKSSPIPPTIYNGKQYNYHICKNCELIFVNPLPTNSELEALYSPSYHQVISKEKIEADKILPGLRFRYQDIYKLLNKYAPSKEIIDFGCGNGKFLYNAYLNGYKVKGVEYNAELVSTLQKTYENTCFYTVRDFYEKPEQHDVLFLSNVLEHFTEPLTNFYKLLSKLKVNGIIIVEGPIENNASLVNYCKWMYLKIRRVLKKNFQTTHAPTHIFFSNAKNQLAFFEKIGLQTLEINIIEKEWPFPENLKNITSLSDIIKFMIAKCSVFLSKFSSNYGNTFIYVGKKIK